MRSLNPRLKIVAPIRDMNLTRDIEIKFAEEQNIPITAIASKYSVSCQHLGQSD